MEERSSVVERWRGKLEARTVERPTIRKWAVHARASRRTRALLPSRARDRFTLDRSAREPKFGPSRILFAGDYRNAVGMDFAVSPDGQHFVEGHRTKTPQLIVIMNWAAILDVRHDPVR